MEQNSLLVHRLGGRMFQVLADADYLYVVYLGSMGSYAAIRRAIQDPSRFRPGPGMERIPKAEVERLSVLVGVGQTELCMTLRGGEETCWHMNCCVPQEGLEALFEGVEMTVGLLPEERALVDADPALLPEGLYDSLRIRSELLPGAGGAGSGGRALAEGVMSSLSLLLPALMWLNQSRMLFFCNLLLLPAGLAILARDGRLSAKRLLWLLPGAAMCMLNLRMNAAQPMQLAIPAASLALMLTLLYALLCRGKRSLRRIAVVLALSLATYAPGAALGLNALRQEAIRVVRTDPVLIRREWVDVRMDGRIRRFYARPEVTRTLSSAEWCELRLCRGALGIEYWIVATNDAVGQV